MAQAKSIPWSTVEKLAKKQFGIKKFRRGQKEIIQTALARKNVLGILPTGAGKSLCFQLPAMLIPGQTVIVSPLIALMQDQVEKLEDVGLQAAKLNSTLTTQENRDSVSDVEEGKTEFIYVTPERLETPECIASLREGGVSLFVVDEAHCISQWGHDFRPAYLSLRKAIEALGSPPVIALTATARPDVKNDILEQLGLNNAKVVNGGIARPNLEFSVVRTVNEEAKKSNLIGLLRKNRGSSIVYVATTKKADELKSFCLEQGLNVERYHAKMKLSERKRVQRGFMADDFQAIIATKAFGLGIDKPDTRLVIHYQFPDSLESYYQEAGRGGRDGKSARAVLLYQLEDKRVQSFFLGGKYPSRADSYAVYTALGQITNGGKSVTQKTLAEKTGIVPRRLSVIVAQLERAGILKRSRLIRKIKDFESPEALDAFLTEYEKRHLDDRQKLESMMKYGQTTHCRVQFLNQYFGYALPDRCGTCDNCQIEPRPA